MAGPSHDAVLWEKLVGSDPRLHWATALQLFGVVALAAIVVLVLAALIVFYRSAKQDACSPASVWLC